MNSPRFASLLVTFSISLAVVIGLQLRGNAYQSEWTGDSDEPVHYLTGLLVHDYVAQGLPGSPIAYARDYYQHYPKIWLGHWPPIFYLVQTSWTLPFTTSRTSLLTLMAMIAALVLTCTYSVIARYFPIWMAWGTVVFLATVPQFQLFSRMVMTEMLTTLLNLIALLMLARHLERATFSTGVWFGLVSLMALLTKATSIALAPLPLLAAVLLDRRGLFRSWKFWLPGIIVAGAAIPWFVLSPDALYQSVGISGGVLRWYRIPESIYRWITWLGVFGAPLVALGFARKPSFLFPFKRADPLWLMVFLLLPVTVILRVFIGPWEARHMLATLPPLMLFLCSGLTWLVDVAFRGQKIGTIVAGTALAMACVSNVASTPLKAHLGLDTVAQELATNPQYVKSSFLIVSDIPGEAIFLAELAAHERRPGHYVERGTTILSNNGPNRVPYFDAEGLMRFFEEQPDRILILDAPPASPAHLDLDFVRNTVTRYQTRWRLVGQYPRSGTTTPIQVLQLVTSGNLPAYNSSLASPH